MVWRSGCAATSPRGLRNESRAFPFAAPFGDSEDATAPGALSGGAKGFPAGAEVAHSARAGNDLSGRRARDEDVARDRQYANDASGAPGHNAGNDRRPSRVLRRFD